MPRCEGCASDSSKRATSAVVPRRARPRSSTGGCDTWSICSSAWCVSLRGSVRSYGESLPTSFTPLPFVYPVFRGQSLLKTRAGLKLFDLLARSAPSDRSTHLSPSETRSYLPGLREPLTGSVLYPEFITDDARFTLANVASAAEHGAWVANHVRVESFLRLGDRIVGARVRDLEGEREFEVRAEVTVNAAGPWAPEVLGASDLPMPHPMIPSKGIHIRLPRSRLPIDAATFLRSAAGRRGLAMPRGPWVYVGTSDTEYNGNLDAVRAEPAEILDLLHMTRDCFPSAALTIDDVNASWAGIRPLVFQAGKTTRETSPTRPGMGLIAWPRHCLGGQAHDLSAHGPADPQSRGACARTESARGRVHASGPPPGEPRT